MGDSSAAFIVLASVQAAATVVLVIVTSIYVCLTRKMAREMKRTRHSSLRPVLLIEPETEKVKPGLAGKLLAMTYSGRLSRSVKCTFRNVGHGPALDIRFRPAGTLGDGEAKRLHLGVGESSPELPLLLEPESGAEWEQAHTGVIGVEYQDVYGNDFRSILKVKLDTKGKSLDHELLLLEGAKHKSARASQG